MNLTPDRYEKLLAGAAILLLGAVTIAIARGQAEWSRVPVIIWLHLLTIIVALALTPVMLLRRRGDTRHRTLGWVWGLCLAGTAALSFGIRLRNDGSLSIIHILSVWTLLTVPLMIWAARNHKIAMHRRAVRGLVTGALLVAGFFTFPFNRLLGHWLFG